MTLTKPIAILSLALLMACQAPPAAQSAPSQADAGLVLAQADSAPRRVPESRADAQASFAPVVREASPAVVNVYALSVRRTIVADPFFGRFGEFFGVPREQVQRSLGSGVIVRPDGVIVTNNHVVEGAQQLKIVLADRREFDARLLLADPRTDLAVLQINPGQERLPAMAFADTRSAAVGDMVLAIGNPFGLQQTVTSGIISALARSEVGINDYSFFIQTDASINRGNSGGALVDMRGRLLGINTAIFSESGGSAGIGFAIPAEMVRRVTESALTEGRIVRPWIGARGQAVDAELARSLGLDRPRGVLVADVYEGGPAARAGIRRGDVVLAVNGVNVVDEAGLRFQFATQRPGATVNVDLLREGRTRQVRVRADAPPASPAADPRDITGANPFAGVRAASLSPALADEAGVDPFLRGALVQAVDRRAPAARFFQPGDVILAVNGEEVRTSQALQRAASAGEGRGWRVAINRQGERGEIAINP